jgi:site-specific recombinase XerD
LEKAKLKYKCIHFLRHSWATNSFEATGDILSVKEMGGWQDIKSVQKYIHVSQKLRKERLNQMRIHMNKRSHVA